MSASVEGRDPSIVFVCDDRDWALGTLAQASARELASQFSCAVLDTRAILDHPFDSLRQLRGATLIVWVSAGHYDLVRDFLGPTRHIFWIHHLHDNTEVRRWPGLVVTSCQQSQAALARLGIEAQVVPYGVDADLFAPRSKSECRRQLQLDDRPTVGFFAKATSNDRGRKGLDVLRAVLAGLHFPVTLLVSGREWGSVWRSLDLTNVSVEERPVASYAEMAILYGAIDVYVCTSRLEGGPLPVLEAMASARPVVSTPVGHVPEVVRHGVSGFIVNPHDIEEFSTHVELCLSQESMAAAMGADARRTVSVTNGVAAMAARLLAVCEVALSMPSAVRPPAQWLGRGVFAGRVARRRLPRRAEPR